jgi:hypothetical protein
MNGNALSLRLLRNHNACEGMKLRWETGLLGDKDLRFRNIDIVAAGLALSGERVAASGALTLGSGSNNATPCVFSRPSGHPTL